MPGNNSIRQGYTSVSPTQPYAVRNNIADNQRMSPTEVAQPTATIRRDTSLKMAGSSNKNIACLVEAAPRKPRASAQAKIHNDSSTTPTTLPVLKLKDYQLTLGDMHSRLVDEL